MFCNKTCKVASQRQASLPPAGTGTPSLFPAANLYTIKYTSTYIHTYIKYIQIQIHLHLHETNLRQILTLESSLQEASLSPDGRVLQFKDLLLLCLLSKEIQEVPQSIRIMIIITITTIIIKETCWVPGKVPHSVRMRGKSCHSHPIIVLLPRLHHYHQHHHHDNEHYDNHHHDY